MKYSVRARRASQPIVFLLALTLGLAVHLAAAETSVVEENQKLLASDAEGYDFFGGSVVVDNDTAVIGAAGKNSNGLDRSGAAYVFIRDGNDAWSEQAKLVPSDAASTDFFGLSVAVDGDTALIGAPGKADVGAAYVFTRDAEGVWSEQAKLMGIDVVPGGRFGESVSLDGNTALIGAPYSADFTGAAYIFVRDGSEVWSQRAKLIAADAATGAIFGERVSLDGDTALIGASWAGAAYVFTRVASGDWSEQTKLNPSAGDIGGVAVKGDTAIIGAYIGSGTAYVYIRDADGVWTKQTELRGSDVTTEFGYSVALDGDIALIGDAVNYVLGNAQQGAAYVFARDARGVWSEKQKLISSDGAPYDEFGQSLALDKGTALIGAPYVDSNGFRYHGAAYVFELEALIGPFEIAIDIRPGNRRNVVNPGSRGRFWVAVLSDLEFDALQVDQATVAFGKGEASPDRYRVKDVNCDGLPDLMLRFRTPEVDLHCGDTNVELTGDTYAGDSIIGSDSVRTVGCKKPKKGKKK